MTQVSAPKLLKTRLLKLMVLRVFIAFIFLGAAAWFQLREVSVIADVFYPLHAIVICLGILTIIYALLLGRVRNLVLFTYFQITVDIVLITVIVYVTGGIESFLPLMYSFSVIGAPILLDRRCGYYAASVSSIAYGTLVDLDFYHVLPDEYKIFWSSVDAPWEDVVTGIATHVLAFFTIAYLTGYLAERTARIERKLEEKEIDYERLETLNRHIVENIASGIMTLDKEWRVTSFNAEAENLTGYSLREVYYRNVDEVIHGIIKHGLQGVARRARFEMNFIAKSGEELCLGFTVSPGQSDEMATIVMFRDLTQLKILEERLRRDEKLKALGELSASMAHEIRNPLASVSGSIQMLKEGLELKGEKLKLMDIVLRETERLNALITDFLLFAMPSEDKLEPVNICRVIRESLSVFENSPEAKGLDIVSSLEDDMFIEGSERQITQLFWNLYLNAAGAMSGGGVQVTAARSRPGRDSPGPGEGAPAGTNGFAEVKVVDTGGGIDPADMSRIFDPFFSTRPNGTGLGLALAHRIVESHGGRIEVESVLGMGTTFTVTFLLIRPQGS